MNDASDVAVMILAFLLTWGGLGDLIYPQRKNIVKTEEYGFMRFVGAGAIFLIMLGRMQ